MTDDFIQSMAVTEGAPVDSTDYRSRIGSLLHLVKWTRPDLAFSVGFLARFSANPTMGALQGVNRVLRYALSTADWNLIINPSIDQSSSTLSFDGYTDSDFASNPLDRKSVGGWIVLLASAPISWSSKRQELVSTSTLEAELIALFNLSQEALFLQRLLVELANKFFNVGTPTLRCDNKGAIALASNPCSHKKSKHIDVKYRALQCRVARKVFIVDYVRTEENIADIMTKPLARVRLFRLCSKLFGCGAEGECWKLTSPPPADRRVSNSSARVAMTPSSKAQSKDTEGVLTSPSAPDSIKVLQHADPICDQPAMSGASTTGGCSTSNSTPPASTTVAHGVVHHHTLPTVQTPESIRGTARVPRSVEFTSTP